MRVLILGGTSFFGAEIVKLLLRAGHQVSVFTRGNKEPEWMDRVDHIQGDRVAAGEFRDRLSGKSFDVVVDNIAYDAQDVEKALAVLGGRIGRYLLTSSAAVYRYVPGRTMPLQEGDVDYAWDPPEYDPDDRGWAYAAGKLAAERALLDQDAVPYTIIRPPVVLGPADPSLRGYFYIQRLLDGQPLILTNGGVNSFRLVFSRDLAGAYLLAMESPAAEGRTYNITQGEIVTVRDFVETAAEPLDVDPHLVDIPYDTLEAAGFQYPEPYSALINFIPSLRRAEDELGYRSTPFRSWVRETATWFRDQYQGEDSAGYGDREREVQFAQGYVANMSLP